MKFIDLKIRLCLLWPTCPLTCRSTDGCNSIAMLVCLTSGNRSIIGQERYESIA